jgi:hypothetical protein
MLSACSGPDTKNPEAVAKAFMDAYRRKDPASMLALMSARDSDNRQTLGLAIQQGPASEAHRLVFGPANMAIMAGKDAKVEGPRFDSRGRSAFKVAQDGGDAYVLLLGQANSRWSIDRLDRMSAAEFRALPDKEPGA